MYLSDIIIHYFVVSEYIPLLEAEALARGLPDKGDGGLQWSRLEPTWRVDKLTRSRFVSLKPCGHGRLLGIAKAWNHSDCIGLHRIVLYSQTNLAPLWASWRGLDGTLKDDRPSASGVASELEMNPNRCRRPWRSPEDSETQWNTVKHSERQSSSHGFQFISSIFFTIS